MYLAKKDKKSRGFFVQHLYILITINVRKSRIALDYKTNSHSNVFVRGIEQSANVLLM